MKVALCVLAGLACVCLRSAAAQTDVAVALPAGVRAVWDLGKAHREATPTRERVCINGLWRWQPAATDGQEVPGGRWGYYRVPGPWPGITNYIQKDNQTLFAHPSWADVRLRDVAAAWYQREITVPREWAGRRIALTADYVNSFAAVYVDGRAAGQISFPAGEADLTSVCRPGQTHVLTLRVAAVPLKDVMIAYNDTIGPREVRGSVARRGLCGDVYLTATPAGPRICNVKVDTSVRETRITLHADLEGVAGGTEYRLRARVKDGERTAAEFTSPGFQAGDLQDGRFTFAEPWMPENLWDIHTPQNMYDLEIALEDANGRLCDAALPVRFGFREFWIDGRDFYLNGTRIFLSSVPLDNAQLGVGSANYAAARESMLRLRGIGINYVYTHNYGCEPGTHVSFEEALRAADDVGMLVGLSQPHFGQYDWSSPDAEKTNGYAEHAAFYVRVAQNHPSVVFYPTSHNSAGYAEDMNPSILDDRDPPRSGGSLGRIRQILRAESIIRALDPTRIVYHHSSGDLGSMFTVNFYTNWAPIQEMSDWFGYWATHGVKPIFTCEYCVPMSWDWTMYRGWYRGARNYGGATVPWEFCLAEWNAQFLGDEAFRISEPEKRNLRWEGEQFRNGRLWHRWDYPTNVGSSAFVERDPVYAAYFKDNWRAFRTWGMSANSPWDHGHFWRLREGVDRGRQDLQVDWDSLQRPGMSPDFIEDRYERIDLAYEREDWIPGVAAQALVENNGPLLAYIGGKPDAFTSKDHNFHPGETFQKQLIVINNSRETVSCACEWSLALPRALGGKESVVLATGQIERLPLTFGLPAGLAPGRYMLTATFRFGNGETQQDSFAVDVLPVREPVRAAGRLALFDPRGETAQLLDRLGVAFERVDADVDASAYDLLIVGKGALTVGGPGPDLASVREGARVVVFEQTPEVLEQRLGFRVTAYGLRNVFQRVPDHPVLSGLRPEHLENWRGDATILPPELEYRISSQFGAPTVSWCGIPVTRVWRAGNRGNVASSLIEKPAAGDFLPIIDGGYSLQYSPLMEHRDGNGLVLFCQMDVTGRTETDPAAEALAANVLEYAAAWQPSPRHAVVYAGDDVGRAHLERAGFAVTPYVGGSLSSDHVLVVTSEGAAALKPQKPALDAWLRAGGRLLALGLTEAEADAFLPFHVDTEDREHIATVFERPAARSPLAGVAPADVHNRSPREFPLVTGGARVVGDGVLAVAEDANAVFCQLVPYEINPAQDAVTALSFTDLDSVDGEKSALVTLGPVTAVGASLSQNVKDIKEGATYTFAAFVRALDGTAKVRLEVERAGSPWDRALRADAVAVGTEWTELHATFRTDKPYPQGWRAYLLGMQPGARFLVDAVRLYEGPYTPRADQQAPNMFADPSFEEDTASWTLTCNVHQYNIKRTYRRTSCLVSRLLANMGAASATPLLERFAEPAGVSGATSLLQGGDFASDENADGAADGWTVSGGARREKVGEEWCQVIGTAEGGDGSRMISQTGLRIERGQWYRVSFKARAEGIQPPEITLAVNDTEKWAAVLPYTTFAPGPEWKEFSFDLQGRDTKEGRTRFQVWWRGGGRLLLSDVRLQPIGDPTVGRWLEGLYMDTPEEWDDPYRFFRW
ncbi:MAG: hypothetical protein GXY85_01800 [Candidatus Brocadiaceae bacterium]|nr:hypothetical protein [Candidatus Brocadiaceae bacterium]